MEYHDIAGIQAFLGFLVVLLALIVGLDYMAVLGIIQIIPYMIIITLNPWITVIGIIQPWLFTGAY